LTRISDCRLNGIDRETIDQANPERLGGVDLFRRSEHFEGFGFADKPRQALRPTPTRYKAEGCSTVSKDRVVRCDPPVAC
jgi:hypothetical protein